MSFYRALHFIFGEYILQTDEKSFPRFANLLAEGKLNFWGSEYCQGFVRFRTSIFSAEEIMKTASEVHAPVEIVDRIGLPFLFSRYRRRYGLILGLAFGLFLIFFSQLFVWKIDISGNLNMSVSEIEKALENCGVAVGTFIPGIDPGNKENRLLLSCEELSSAAISIRGTHISVSVLERTPLPDIVDTGGYYNVVAARDGVILDMDASEGTPQVREGDTVFAGELLINSFIEGENGSFRPTHARGIVYAAVEEYFETVIPLDRSAKHYTGAIQTKTSYKILGFDLPSISGDETDFEYFDASYTEKIIKLFGFIELPVRQYKIVYTEYVPQTQRITVETAELLVRAELKNYLDDFGLEVLDCRSSFTVDEENGVCRLTANAVLKQDIAKEVKYDIYNISERLPNARE